MSKISVLVVDDSALMRKILTELLNSDPGIEVVGSAMDAYVARDKNKKLDPDVLTLDIEMPKMDGLSFLRNLMRLRPMPVLMVSSLTEKGAGVTLEALELGAVDFVSKPRIDLAHSFDDIAGEIISKVKIAAMAKVSPSNGSRPHMESQHASGAAKQAKPRSGTIDYKTTDKVIAIGASTGGTEAIKHVLLDMHADSPGVVITQHIPPVFSASFAERMDKISALKVCEARHGQQVLPGHAFIAPGDQHLMVVRDGARYRCKLTSGEPVNRHRPSVDVLFESAAEVVPKGTVAVLLTGMGQDGARGMLRLAQAGAYTIAQDQKTSVVYGMPRVAVELHAVKESLPLEQIGPKLRKLVVDGSDGTK